MKGDGWMGGWVFYDPSLNFLNILGNSKKTVAVRLATWLAVARLILGIGWVGYEIFLVGDRNLQPFFH